MNNAIERSIQLYKVTKGPLRCLSAKDPCNLRRSIFDRSKDRFNEDAQLEEKAPWEKL